LARPDYPQPSAVANAVPPQASACSPINDCGVTAKLPKTMAPVKVTN
jgi:hypothetical protein